MNNNAPFYRVPALVLASLLSIGAFFLVIVAVQAAGPTDAVLDCATVSSAEQECLALVELYEDTGGDNWTINSGWLSGSPCDGWYGVTCDKTGRVQQIILTANNLEGTLPGSIVNLEKLTLLHLGLNQIGGAVPEITREQSPLFALYLNENTFEGEVPASLGSLTSLEFLYLNGNKLSGAVPAELCSLKPIAEDTGIINLAYNALDNGASASDTCVDATDDQWRVTQTVPPSPRLQTRERAPNGTFTYNDAGELTITWEPIDFTEGGGFYEVYQSNKSGEYGDVPVARTANKTQNSVTVGGIVEGRDYFWVVRTKSYANDFNPNVVDSEFSEEITNNPVALTLTDFQAVSHVFPLLTVAAAFLLLASLSIAVVAGKRN